MLRAYKRMYNNYSDNNQLADEHGCKISTQSIPVTIAGQL
ncbi:hypothetical protein SAMN05444682_101177 [Parapedobacter indicus]|uniref:Uncharacterized protein n=1 Tax=Parapedobacter indicus TaxID=1477437 RepID=A0A1I3CT68_9SPHI|nr:hypothetical protein CLV26_101190 [Parapedobacter indicus]SFH77722.1 hypothetical protein SAMN05444682_101177 [Parapedobacter indicus]